MNVADRSKFFLAKLPQNIVEIVDCQLLSAIKTSNLITALFAPQNP